MKLSNKIAIISLIVTIIGMIISYNLDSTEKVSQKKEVNHSVILINKFRMEIILQILMELMEMSTLKIK